MSQRDSALQIKLMRNNWEKLAPGMYLDELQQVHVYPDELLAACGLPVTAENVRQVEEEILSQLPGVPVSHVKDLTH